MIIISEIFSYIVPNFGRNVASPSVHLFHWKNKYGQIITYLENNAIQNLFFVIGFSIRFRFKTSSDSSGLPDNHRPYEG